jgi:hypothetical protein
MAFPAILIGEVAELLARAYVLAAARGRLTTFEPDADVDHKDFIVDRRGGDRHAYIQVKCATRLRQKQVWCVARYLPHKVPTSARLFYLFAFLDLRSIELTRMWLVPAHDFNRLAYRRQHRSRTELWFKARRKTTGGTGFQSAVTNWRLELRRSWMPRPPKSRSSFQPRVLGSDSWASSEPPEGIWHPAKSSTK